MARPSEILFVDPSVSDIETILGNLRPEVHPVVLDGNRPAVRQISAALETREGLDAVHVIAHGAPGRVGFSAGDWLAATINEAAEDFAGIGRSLAVGGDLRLWSCKTAWGAAGAAFVEALAEATGANVSAASARVGAAALGGVWRLSAGVNQVSALPPLTQAGTASYAGVLSFEVTLTGNTDPVTVLAQGGPGAVSYYITDPTGSIVFTFVLPFGGDHPVVIPVTLPSELTGTQVYTITAIAPSGPNTAVEFFAGRFNSDWDP